MNDIIKYIKKVLQDYDSSLDLRDGSALSDLLVAPAAAIITDLKARQDVLFDYQTLKDPENLSEDVLDSFATSFLVNRTVGTKASGYIKLYFTSPKNITIPYGTTFENNIGKQYKTTSSYVFTENDLRANNTLSPYYATGDIYVEAAAKGTDYESLAGTVTKLITKISSTPAIINNPLPITGSSEHESNSSLYTKIIDSSLNKTVYASNGIGAVLKEEFPSITNVYVVGKSHDKMLRDLSYTYNVSGVTYNVLFEKSDYFGSFGPVSSGYIYSGILSSPFYHFYPFNESIAYFNGVTYSGVMTSGTLPATSQFLGSEFSLDQYAGLYKNDSAYATVETRIILDENFNDANITNRGWIKSDSSTGLGNLRFYKEVTIQNGKLKLGHNPQTDSSEAATIVVDTNLLLMISGLIERAVNL